MSEVLAIVSFDLLDSSHPICSGSGTRTRDTAIMSRLLYRLSYPAAVPPPACRPVNAPYGCRIPSVRGCTEVVDRAPMRNRTADLLLTMETLCLLSYRGQMDARRGVVPTHQDTQRAGGCANRSTGSFSRTKASPKRETVVTLVLNP